MVGLWPNPRTERRAPRATRGADAPISTKGTSTCGPPRAKLLAHYRGPIRGTGEPDQSTQPEHSHTATSVASAAASAAREEVARSQPTTRPQPRILDTYCSSVQPTTKQRHLGSAADTSQVHSVLLADDGASPPRFCDLSARVGPLRPPGLQPCAPRALPQVAWSRWSWPKSGANPAMRRALLCQAPCYIASARYLAAPRPPATSPRSDPARPGDGSGCRPARPARSDPMMPCGDHLPATPLRPRWPEG